MSHKAKNGCKHSDELKRLNEYIKNLQEERRTLKHAKEGNKHSHEQAFRSNECDECFSELYEDEFSQHQLRWGG